MNEKLNPEEEARQLERYSRQVSLIPREKLLEYGVTIIGVGAVGRQVALQLTAMGCPYLQLIDPDYVEESNLASQGYRPKDLGDSKVTAMKYAVENLNYQVVVEVAHTRFKSTYSRQPIVFCCVDSIETRKQIWRAVQKDVAFFVDSRMAAEVCRIISIDPRVDQDYYESTLFPAAEAVGVGCTTQTTIYCANITAGLLIAQYVQFLRGQERVRDYTLAISTTDLIIHDSGPQSKLI